MLLIILLSFSSSVVSDSLQPCGLQHARLPYHSLSPGVCSKSWPLSQWCYLTISSSDASFSFCLQSFLATGFFPMSQLFISGGQIIGASASAAVLPMNIQGWFPFVLPCLISLLSEVSKESSPAPQLESINSSPLSFLYIPTLISIRDYWKNHSFDYKHLCQQRSVLCNKL